jgi:hypothetical protein
MTKHYWCASCKFFILKTFGQVNAMLFQSFRNAMPLDLHQASEAQGGFLIIDQWHIFSTDLQKIAVSYYLATCFSH